MFVIARHGRRQRRGRRHFSGETPIGRESLAPGIYPGMKARKRIRGKREPARINEV